MSGPFYLSCKRSRLTMQYHINLDEALLGEDGEKFLKTLFPSRKHTKRFITEKP